MTDATKPRPVVLCVLDGWGWREDPADNAVLQADTPAFDRLWAAGPRAFLRASEEEVGLPAGQIGNSEVGHMNLGAGRVVLQDLLKVDKAVADGDLARNTALQAHIAKLRETDGTCHLMGLLSPGGVHAHQDHMAALAKVVAEAGVPVAVHAFTDGRDTPPKAGRDYMAAFLEAIAGVAGIDMATVDGRYYAMDRDKRWERVKSAYRAVAEAEGRHAADALSAIQAAYDANVTDEFVEPTVIDGYEGMKDGDGVLFANFRADRAREILTALLDPEFDGFERRRIAVADACGMVEYSERLNAFMSAIFPPKSLTHVMGEVVAARGLTQLRVAETEKYPHVTFFFNGGEEHQFPGEDRILVPSPKVATYDLQPEMSAPEVGRRLVEAVDSGKYDLVIVNFANPDMVGHTGSLPAAIKAVETVDKCLGDLVAAVERQQGAMIVTADHGNCEMMRDPETGGPHTAHTLNPVPVVLVGGPAGVALRNGNLADVAPTLLELMGIDQPEEMTGRSLMVPSRAQRAAE
ncbi:MAG TPA: 2,3-bisphosphoglycerate-independent phosphoglycerate mutase [Alphaproteobacteria bacterium]|nr:2,3-bisphosphoglycerate-independent phosphoglycerate mutase [Alphaproteobacteria bacterium]